MITWRIRTRPMQIHGDQVDPPKVFRGFGCHLMPVESVVEGSEEENHIERMQRWCRDTLGPKFDKDELVWYHIGPRCFFFTNQRHATFFALTFKGE